MAMLLAREDANEPWTIEAQGAFWEMPEKVHAYVECGFTVDNIAVLEEPFTVEILLEIHKEDMKWDT